MHAPTSPHFLPIYSITSHSYYTAAHICLCWLVSICPHSTATVCPSLAWSMPLQGSRPWTMLAHLASLPFAFQVDWVKERYLQESGRWEEREVRLSLSTCPFPACLPGAQVSSRCSSSYDFSYWCPHSASGHSKNSWTGVLCLLFGPQVLTASYCC